MTKSKRLSSYGGMVLRNQLVTVESLYDIDSAELGASSTGSVHEVTRKKDGRKFALKVIDLTSVQEEFHEQLRQEIDILRNLDHPNIVKLFEVYESGDDKLHLIMELCTGGELYQKLIAQSGQRYAEKKAANLVDQMLRAVCYCHNKGIAHRDIKMANFLLESDSDDAKLKMIDFGFSKMFYKDNGKMSTFVGTPHYIAPEVLQGAYNESSDVWSIGVMAYMLVVGYPPFSAKPDEDVLEKIKKGIVSMEGKRWKDVSKACQTFIRKLLQKNPKRRIRAEDALQDRWILEHTNRDAQVQLSKKLLVRLASFHKFGNFKQVCRVVMAHVCEYEEKDVLQNVFYAIDEDHSGRIDENEMIEVLLRSGLTVATSKKIFRSIDVDMSGTIRFSEFTAATMDDEYSDVMLETVFQRLKNEEDLITPEAIKSVVSDLTSEKCCAMMQASPYARRRPHADGSTTLALDKESFFKTIRQKGRTKARIARMSSSHDVLPRASPIKNDESVIERMDRSDLLACMEEVMDAPPIDEAPPMVMPPMDEAPPSVATSAVDDVATETKTQQVVAESVPT